MTNEQEYYEACDTCEYKYKAEGEEPCKECSHSYVSKWKPKQPTVLDKIRAEIDDATEIHSDGELYIKNIDVKRIIDKYKEVI